MTAPRALHHGGRGNHVDGAVLSGTPIPVFSGTRIPYHQERDRPASIGFDRRNPAPLTSLTKESFGFLLTRSAVSRNRGQPRSGRDGVAMVLLRSPGIAP